MFFVRSENTLESAVSKICSTNVQYSRHLKTNDFYLNYLKLRDFSIKFSALIYER